MKNSYTRILCFLLSAIMLACSLTACGNKESTKQTITFASQDTCGYKVIYSTSDGQYGRESAADIYLTIKQFCSAEVTLTDDSTDISEYEILIGNTNRTETETAKGLMGESNSIITVVGKKLVVYSTDAKAYPELTKHLIDVGFTDTSFSLAADFSYNTNIEIKEDIPKENTFIEDDGDMRFTIQKKYIAIPINTKGSDKFLSFYEIKGNDKKLIMDFQCKIDPVNPNYTAYIDVSRFIGTEVEYSTFPVASFSLRQYDERPLENLYSEPYRPYSHFTTATGFINDPNGMIKYNGVYHMFYQYNPCNNGVANMSWGHATSTDLIHWEEQDVALFPDEMGTKYSGSAIEDVNNVTGLKTGEHNPIILFYTAAGDKGRLAGGKKRTQCIAYSVDGGKTFETYKNNPIIPHIEGYNRDPKVVWVEEINKFVLSLYMDGDRFALFTSENLLDWKLLQQISIKNERECADMHSYVIDGVKYWIIMGANDIYVVGQFIDGKFVKLTEPRQLCPYMCSYAGQSISGMDDGRVVRVTCEQLNTPFELTNRQMSIPQELKLVKIGEEFFLTANPVEEIKQIYASTNKYTPGTLNSPYSVTLSKNSAYDIHIKGGYAGDMLIDVFGQVIEVSAANNTITFGKAVVQLSHFKDSKDIRIIVDRCSIELFVDGGKQFIANLAVCDYKQSNLTLSSTNGATVTELSISKLENIH